MAADIQYADALKVLDVLEREFLEPNEKTVDI